MVSREMELGYLVLAGMDNRRIHARGILGPVNASTTIHVVRPGMALGRSGIDIRTILRRGIPDLAIPSYGVPCL